jgi:hypothetical protein
VIWHIVIIAWLYGILLWKTIKSKRGIVFIPSRYLEPGETYDFPDGEIESGRPLSQDQLKDARVFASREEYAKQLPKGMKWMEIGVAWGYYSDYVCSVADPRETHLSDTYDQDLKCWSWRKFGECKCNNQKHEMLYTPDTHEQYIINKFSKYNNVKTIKGYAPYSLPKDNDYDYIYLDTGNERYEITGLAEAAHKLVKVGGLLGFNDYLIYDGIIEDQPYGTFQAVNEFLHFNKNWSLDAIALHPVGFYDAYLRKNYE